MAVEALKLPRHLPVTRHHVKQTDHCHDGGVGRTQEQEEKNNSNDPSENLTDRRRKRGGCKLFADETEHVFAALSQNRRDFAPVREMQCFAKDGRQGKHRPAEQSRAEDNLDRHGDNRLNRLASDAGVFHRRSWIELHHACEVRD